MFTILLLSFLSPPSLYSVPEIKPEVLDRYLYMHTKYRFESVARPRVVTTLDGTRTGQLYEVEGRRVVVDTTVYPYGYKRDMRRFWVLAVDDRPVSHQSYCPIERVKICKPPG